MAFLLPSFVLLISCISYVTGQTGPPCTETAFSIPNGDFESGQLSPWIQKNGPNSPLSNITVVSPGHNSAYAVQLSADYATILRQNYVPTCQATNFSISFDYQITTISPNCEFGVYVTRTGFIGAGITIPSAVSGWTTASFIHSDFTATSFAVDAALDCHPDQSSGTVQLDNFAITAVASLEPQDCPRPVSVPNGGFDSGSLAPWNFQDYATNAPQYGVVSPGYNSNYALQFDQAATTSATSWSIYQTIDDLCLVYNYTVSFAADWGNYSYPTTGSSQPCYITVEPFSCSGSKTLNRFFYAPAPNSGWQEISFGCTPISSGSTILDVSVNCYIGSNAPPVPALSLQLDSFTVEFTP